MEGDRKALKTIPIGDLHHDQNAERGETVVVNIRSWCPGLTANCLKSDNTFQIMKPAPTT